MFAVVTGFSLFWACLFAMLMRNAFLDAGIPSLWYHLVLRIAFCIGFGAVALVVSRIAGGALSKRIVRPLFALVALFAVIAVVSSGTYALFGSPHPLPFDLAAWGLSGVSLSCLLFVWVPAIARMDEKSAAQCMALSLGCGAVAYLVVNLLPPLFNTALLASCPLVSLAVRQVIAREETQRGILESPAVPCSVSRKNASLSWSFGVIYVVYGIVFGLGTGSVTQIAAETPLFAGIAASVVLGAAAAWAFMRRFAGRMRQIDVLRMLFPFLVVALVAMSFFTGTVSVLSNLLVLACYVFLVAVSVAFEVQTARARCASPLYVVGMSQGALNAGMAAGFGLGLLPSLTGATDYAVLSAVALGLVVLLAVFITFAPSRQSVVDEEPEGQPEQHEQGRWKARCTAVARNAGLSARETEVFFLLAKGRGIEHIQNKLCISGHTVKTHTYNIYRKMGIGSREELLDAIEAADPEDGAERSRAGTAAPAEEAAR